MPGDTCCEVPHDGVNVDSHPDQDGATPSTTEEMPGDSPVVRPFHMVLRSTLRMELPHLQLKRCLETFVVRFHMMVLMSTLIQVRMELPTYLL